MTEQRYKLKIRPLLSFEFHHSSETASHNLGGTTPLFTPTLLLTMIDTMNISMLMKLVYQ